MSRREEYNRFSGGANLPDKDTMTAKQATEWQRKNWLLELEQAQRRVASVAKKTSK